MTFEELARHAHSRDTVPKIVVCEVGQGLRVEALILRWDMDRVWTVQESVHCRPGKLLLINDLRNRSVGMYPPVGDTEGDTEAQPT